MILEAITVGFMFGTVVVKWATASAIQSKQSRLAEASEKNGHARQCFKMAAGEVSITDRDIDKLRRKIKVSERRIAQLQEETTKLSKSAQEKAELDQEKLRLAQEMQNKKGPS